MYSVYGRQSNAGTLKSWNPGDGYWSTRCDNSAVVGNIATNNIKCSYGANAITVTIHCFWVNALTVKLPHGQCHITSEMMNKKQCTRPYFLSFILLSSSTVLIDFYEGQQNDVCMDDCVGVRRTKGLRRTAIWKQPIYFKIYNTTY